MFSRRRCCAAVLAYLSELGVALVMPEQMRGMKPRSEKKTVVMATQEREVGFSKYQGIGNDFILVDGRGSTVPSMSPEAAAKLCDRNFGVGGDGVIFVLDAEAEANDYQMRIYNSDSSEPEMCGNGIRCLARYMQHELGIAGSATEKGEAYKIETGAGVMVPEVRSDGLVTVDMGPPELDGPKIPTTLPTDDEGRVIEQPGVFDYTMTCVSMGNPHAVTFLDDVDAVALADVGPKCEHHPAFPERVNTHFVQVIDRKTLKMRVWERGAGPTLACGTGACAVAVAAVLTDRADRQCTVQLPGGDLDIEWREDDNRLYMSGPATFVFKGFAPLSSDA